VQHNARFSCTEKATNASARCILNQKKKPYTPRLPSLCCHHFDLCTANGTTIPTYGWLPLNLNLRLRRNFTWRFVVAYSTQPLIGVNFLSHFGLLVDCKHNRLLGRHSCFIPVSRGTRTTSIVSTRLTSEVRDPDQPGERNDPSIQDYLPQLQNLRQRFPAAGRTNNLSTEV
jgi:hypothetical protein